MQIYIYLPHYGLSVLEAMSIGLPVILSNCVGNRDLVEDNGVLYIDKIEAVKNINELLKNKIWTNKKGHNSKIIVENNFNMRNMAISYLNIYKGMKS